MGKTLDNLEDISKIDAVEVTANVAAPQATTYTKTESDTLFSTVGQTALKANQATTYTKIESDANYEPKDGTILKDSDIGVTVLAPDGDGSSLTGLQSPLVAGTDYLAPDGDGSQLTGLPAGYANSDVDTHLNTSTATEGQVLARVGSDYDWIDAGGGVAISTSNHAITGLSDNFSQIAKIQASDPEADDLFGRSVSVSGTRIVVGAYYEDTTASNAGSAYIYDINGNFIAKIQANDPQADDRFGVSVSVSDTRIVVGAYYEDTNGSAAGSVYIYDINGNFISKIQANDPQADDRFGDSVSVSGTRIVVGAYLEDTTASNAGSAYIYDINGNFIAKIQASDPEASDYFGHSVSVSDTRIVVGAYYENTTYSDAGSAYIYDINGNFIAKIQASDPGNTDRFGESVSASNNRIVVGTRYEGSLAGAGSAYIYDINGNFIHKIQASDPEISDYFGISVSVSETRIVVGAYQEDTTASNAGSAYIYDINGNFIAKIQASDPQESDNFGWSVSVSDTRIVVGAKGEDTTASAAGSAYILNNFYNDVESVASTVYNQTSIMLNLKGE